PSIFDEIIVDNLEKDTKLSITRDGTIDVIGVLDVNSGLSPTQIFTASSLSKL
ncbi:8303_t:CDS:2, partial [Dentiscutata erythropus]